MLVRLSIDDLRLINNALNEVCNGVLISDAAFPTRVGSSRDQARLLLGRLGGLLDDLARKDAAEGYEQWLAEFGGRAPDLETVAALRNEAIGPCNQELRLALGHYGLIRSLAPAWLQAISDSRLCRFVIPKRILESLVGTLSSPPTANRGA